MPRFYSIIQLEMIADDEDEARDIVKSLYESESFDEYEFTEVYWDGSVEEDQCE